MKFLTIGNGAWGTAVASLLAEAGMSSRLAVSRRDLADGINTNNRNEQYLPGLDLHPGLRAILPAQITNDSADCIIWAIPIQFLRSRSREFRALIPEVSVMINLGKGIETDTAALPSEILHEEFPGVSNIGTLAGPNIAGEIVKGMYAEATLAFNDHDLGSKLANCFNGSPLKVHVVRDVRGLEIAAALKNVAALIGGTADGLKLGDNCKAILIARIWEELVDLGFHMNAGREIFYSCTAIADLYATANSPEGRNRRVGEMLGSNFTLPQAMNHLDGRVAEGVATAFVVLNKASSCKLNVPLLASLCALMKGDIDTAAYLQRVTSGPGTSNVRRIPERIREYAIA